MRNDKIAMGIAAGIAIGAGMGARWTTSEWASVWRSGSHWAQPGRLGTGANSPGGFYPQKARTIFPVLGLVSIVMRSRL